MKKYLALGMVAVFSLVLVSRDCAEERKVEWNSLTEKQKQELIEKEKRIYREKNDGAEPKMEEKKSSTEWNDLTEQQKRERREKEVKAKSSTSSTENGLTEQQKRERREKEAKGNSNSQEKKKPTETGKKIEGLKITSFDGVDGRVVGQLKSIDEKENLVVVTVETQDILKGDVSGHDVTIKVTKKELENAKEGDKIKVRIKPSGVFKVTVQ